MVFEGFTPYDPEAAELYKKKRWWLGITLGDMFDRASDLYPEREALVGSGKRFTWAQLRTLVDKMAYNLLQEGFQPGDTVLLQLPNWPEFVISYYALQKAGLVMVSLTVNHTAREIAHLANLTQPKGWILPDRYRKIDYLPLIKQVKEENPILEKVILIGGEISEGCLKFEDLLETKAGVEEIRSTLEQARPDPGDVFQILPSGGTTGLPKGAPRTHNDYVCNIEYKSKAWDLNVTDTVLVASPVGHNLALLVCVTGSVFQGAKQVLLDSTYPQDFCQIVQEEKITCTGLVPTLISRIVNFEDLGQYDLSSLNKIYVGAANSPPELVKNVEDRIGARYINAFGMVEGPLSQSRPHDPLEIRCNTIGRPCCPYDDIVTLDSSGKKTPPGVEGELSAKGPGIFTGYLKNPQANMDSFTPHGYFRTGDLAVIDEKGTIRITGRIKDIIIRGGENIAARDVEDLISSHPHVEYVAVVGMPDPDLGEQVCAYVKPVEGASVMHEEVITHLDKMEASKIHYPARTEIVQEMPLTAAGKADKKVLKKDIEAKLKSESEKT
ncbi:MAG: AMP-binding protein [Desulfobacteraceae bacterium]|jgi:2,3-dihydroxybenzoate-AMP ligase/mycobactin salicyl-AMP ligase